METNEKDKPPNPAENGRFIILIRIAREDGETGRTLRRILSLDEPERKALISELTVRMRLQGEPADLIGAVEYLFNNEIAEQVRQTLA